MAAKGRETCAQYWRAVQIEDVEIKSPASIGRLILVGEYLGPSNFVIEYVVFHPAVFLQSVR